MGAARITADITKKTVLDATEERRSEALRFSGHYYYILAESKTHHNPSVEKRLDANKNRFDSFSE
jgi:hypothetical protein